MKNFFRDKTRDNLAKDLNSSGIKAEMAERGRFEEKLRSGRRFPGRNVPLGVIDITGEKIPWINVIRSVNRGKNNPPRHRIVFGIRDDSLPKGHEAIEIKMIRKKSVPLIGKVVDVQWEGRESLLPLTKALNDDIELKDISRLINEHIPPFMRMDYLRMINDVYITKQRKEEIIDTILEILEEHGYNEEGQNI